MNKTILTAAIAIVFGSLSNAVIAGDALDQGDSANYGQPHAAPVAIVQPTRASVADIGDAAAYPDRLRSVQPARAQREDRLPVAAGTQAFDASVYGAN